MIFSQKAGVLLPFCFSFFVEECCWETEVGDEGNEVGVANVVLWETLQKLDQIHVSHFGNFMSSAQGVPWEELNHFLVALHDVFQNFLQIWCIGSLSQSTDVSSIDSSKFLKRSTTWDLMGVGISSDGDLLKLVSGTRGVKWPSKFSERKAKFELFVVVESCFAGDSISFCGIGSDTPWGLHELPLEMEMGTQQESS